MITGLILLSLAFQTPLAEVPGRWLEYLRQGRVEPIRQEMGRDPSGAPGALEEVLKLFDLSIHSHRDRPEQRRVSYSQELLQEGLKLSALLEEVTGNGVLRRRFEARRDRIRATELLNDQNFETALSIIESVRKTARELEDDGFLFTTYLSGAYAYLGLGQAQKALEECQTGLEIAQNLDSETQRTLAVFNLGTAYLHTGQLDQARLYSEEAARRAAGIGNRVWEANAWLNIGYVDLIRNDLVGAEAALSRTLTLSQEAGDRLGEGRAWYNLGLVYVREQRWPEARRHLERSLEFIREVDIRHSHEIDEYNRIEKEALGELLFTYHKLAIRDPLLLQPIQERLAEFDRMPRPRGHHH